MCIWGNVYGVNFLPRIYHLVLTCLPQWTAYPTRPNVSIGVCVGVCFRAGGGWHIDPGLQGGPRSVKCIY